MLTRDEIRRIGPTRVVVDKEGYATTSGRALREHLLVPDVVFIRKDGWSLGAPWQYASVAWQMWAGDWVDTLIV